MSRFTELVAKLHAKGMSEEEAKGTAANIGRRKYGKKRFAEMGAEGKLRSRGRSVHLSNDLELGLLSGAAHVVKTIVKHAPRIKKATVGALKNGFKREKATVKSYFNKQTALGRKAFRLASTGGRIGAGIGRAAGAVAGVGGTVIKTALKHPLKTTAGVLGAGVLLRPKQNPLLEREPETHKLKPIRYKVKL